MARAGLIILPLLALAMVMTGIRWGLPSRRLDQYLFESNRAWSGKRLVELKGADWQQRDGLGADVDVDPLVNRNRVIELTDTDRKRAEILIRYRLYSNQPDEHLALRALASMRPSQLDFDPKLYFYGGSFIYPVGMLMGLTSSLGLIEAHGDLASYLDRPGEFGDMVVVVRVYSAIFGLIGVVACYLVARRLGHSVTGVLAGLLFLCMPIIVTLSHEGKPHLAGAVMMLLAGLAGCRYVEKNLPTRWWTMAIVCGLAAAMVLSAWPVMTVMVVAICLRPCESRARTIRRLLGGMLAAGMVFVMANPYLGINLIRDPDVIRSNLGNPASMYEIGRLGQGMWTVARLLVEDTGPISAALGTVTLIVLLIRRTRMILPLAVPAGLILLQFACIGAGKPDQFGRFLAFPAVLMAITAAWGAVAIFHWRRRIGICLGGLLLVSTGWSGYGYLAGFVRDAGTANSRTQAATWLAERLGAEPDAVLGLVREPAPYCVPPVDFTRRRVLLLPEGEPNEIPTWPDYVIATVDRPDDLDTAWWASRYRRVAVFPANLGGWMHRPTVISWADKPVLIFRRGDAATRPAATSRLIRLPVTRRAGRE